MIGHLLLCRLQIFVYSSTGLQHFLDSISALCYCGCKIFLSCFSAKFAKKSGEMWPLNITEASEILHQWPVFSAGIFVSIALLLSLFLIFEHLAFYNIPEEQKFLIGLILMVPVYAVESFLSLLNSRAAFNFEVMRDCYEAFAMYCFERYLIACLGGEDSTIKFMENQAQINSSTPLLEASYADGVVKHPFPLNYLLRQWHLGPDFYHAVKVGIVQYMILKTICALLAIVFEFFGVYGEGKFEWNYGYPYLAVVLNFSQTWALYCLVQFYSVTKEKLEPIKPLAKFLVFKSIVFLTWWQGVAIALLSALGAFKGSLAQELKMRIQDYIICIEMGVAAIVHIYVFPAKPYENGERCVRNVSVMSDYASLGSPPDPEEVRDSERLTRVRLARSGESETRLSFTQSVRDVVVGSGEIVVDDVKYTVSHVVEPVERGIAKINETFHQISENVKRHEMQRRNSKDDSHIVPLRAWKNEFSGAQDHLLEGSVSDSGLASGKKHQHHNKGAGSQM
ncbi:Organic solute transporter Ost-alpha [Cinnamomum micranthum f. kanehirae]|uniref:Organic solute transporter Ost-alpha n=1 Tax=Cinnamomum micranthum f. kanehirae TaxID=337451 RepID=A0A3S3P405_9MAGN|nr:Organic solute transporter Ost-alpha [Cinnamomum micranthum f. kanehirae]